MPQRGRHAGRRGSFAEDAAPLLELVLVDLAPCEALFENVERRTAWRSERRWRSRALPWSDGLADQGQPIAAAMIAALRVRRALLPAADTLDRVGRAARAIACRRMEAALLEGLSAERLSALDHLLVVDPAIRMTPFAWLRALPEAPSEKNPDTPLDRLRFVQDLGLDQGR